ncbi:S-layer homology domain-containing protein [Paenibacillus wynnii]|uniref:S-layer homology domain-containing protein n=1 Tax=Paenibacillus wynnii TaxID=268407 RepID=UPI0006897AC2|nr:S-layer homology domain-containing protein [Paenibacillus wynnii]
MKRFRSAVAGLLVMLLIFSSLPVYGEGGNSAGTGGTGAGQVSTGTVLIQNKWKSNFLYETSQGIVRYGMTNPADASAQWIVVTTNGLSRIKNVKTGHYITLAGNTGKEDSLKTATEGGASAEWLIDTSNRAGYMVIRSATAPTSNLVIHEENQLGYAQVSSDINVTFESPQWAFVDLNGTPVRLESRMHPGAVIYEDTGYVQAPDNPNGNLKHGQKPSNDTTSQWYIEPGSTDGNIKFRNRATGHYIKQNEDTGYGIFSTEIDLDKVSLSEWIQQSADDHDSNTSDAGYVTFENAGLTAGGPQWMNPQFPNDNHVRSNGWPGWSGNVTAHWKIVLVSDLQATRITTYTDAQVVSDFLYETENGELKHGTITDHSLNEMNDLWYVEDYDGNKRIRNAATNHYLTYSEGQLTGKASIESSPSDQWRFKESDDYDDYQTIGNIGTNGIYLSQEQGGIVGASSDAASLNVQWQFIDPNAPMDGSEHYIRIQNGWKSFYWYESSDGLLKYGNLQTDQSDQWLVEKYNGRKLFKNRKTGHYINMVEMPSGHIQVTTLTSKIDVNPGYIWTGKNTGDNQYVISNVLDKEPNKRPDKYISLQNLTKYAEYSVINPDWGSPKWRFVQVTEKKQDLFRFRMNEVNGEEQYLKDGPMLAEATQELTDTVTDATYKPMAAAVSDLTVGQATYGPLDLADNSFLWQLKEIDGANGAVKIQNRGTGRYLSLEHLGGAVEEDNPATSVQTLQTIYDVWGSIKWYVDMKSSGITTFKSGWGGHYMYGAPDEDGNPVIRISKAAGAVEMDSAQFMAEPAFIPAPPVPDYPIRFKNIQNGEYLYENEHGVILYGQPSSDNGYSHWSILLENGKQFVVNRATGHYLTLNGDYSFLESTGTQPATDGSSNWSVDVGSDGQNYTIRSMYGEYSDEFVNVENQTGYAERALLLETSPSARWNLERAEQDYMTPAGEPRNSNTSTPAQDDTNIVTIVPKGLNGYVLAEKEGQIILAGTLDKNAKSNWRLQDYNGRKRLLNIDTKHFLSLDDQGKPVLLSSGTTTQSQWTTTEKMGYYLLESADADEVLIHQNSEVDLGANTSDDDTLWSFIPTVTDVDYAGEIAFKGEEVIRFTVNADHAGEYKANVRYKNAGAVSVLTKVEVNGLKQDGLSLDRTAQNTPETAELQLNLRSGLNTVSFSGDGMPWSPIEIDSLTIKDSVNKSYRGATVPYISYEAEDAVTNGSLIGPSRKPLSLSSEASGRKAVSLKNTGEYVEFKLAKPANSIVLRYSIPDSPDGKGAEETLSLYVNGAKQQLKLTSKYAWEYGSYPWSNDPSQGNGHRFFDEIHALIGDAPAGATIRLVKEAENQATSYVIDLMDMEQVAPQLSKPDGFISVADFGAVANDGKDDTAAFKATLAEGKAHHKGVWFPAGEFHFEDGLLDLDSAEIRGAGMWYTTLYGAKFFGHGGKVGVYDLQIDGVINVRDDEAVTNAFHGAFGQGSVIQNVWIEHTKAGLWLTQPRGEKARTNGLHMVGLRIRNLMADGINFAVGTSNSMMEQSDIRYPGDDGIAMWSFTDASLVDVNGTERTPSVNNTARFNTVSLPWLADNIVVFGGKDNKIQDNIVKDTVTNGAGIAVSTRFSAEPFQGTTIVERNTMIRTGSYDSGYGLNLGALWLYAGESDMGGTIRIMNNTALDSTYSGFIAHGHMTVSNVTLLNNVIDGAGTSGIEITKDLKGQIIADNVIVRGEKMNQISNQSPVFKIIEMNQGLSTSVKPFSIVLDDGQIGPVVLKQGESAKLKVLDRAGADITDQAKVDFGVDNVASFISGNLQALKEGVTTFKVSVGDNVRNYEVVVVSKSVTGGGTDPIPPSGNPSLPAKDIAINDALLKDKAASKQLIIEVNATTDGTARFGAESLRSAAAASPDSVLLIQSAVGTYQFPLKLVESVLKQANLPGGVLEFHLALKSDNDKVLASAAKEQGFLIKGTPVEFSLKVTDGMTTIPVTGFGTTYVERTFTISEEVNIKSAVALIFDSKTGAFHYVPALFEVSKGVTKVTVKSTLASGVVAIAVNPITFKDVSSGHWAKAEIELLASRLIVNGQSTSGFAPGKSVSRAEFAAMLIRSLGLQPDGTSASMPPFKDVPSSAWYATDAGLAAKLGLVQGYEDGSFRPNASVTREQMAVMAGRAIQLLQTAVTKDAGNATTIHFNDAEDISNWAKGAIDVLVSSGIMKGQPSGAFAPGKATSRAEAAVILERLLTEVKLLNK